MKAFFEKALEYLKDKVQSLVVRRNVMPSLSYHSQALIGKPYESNVLSVKKFEAFVAVTREFAELRHGEKARDYAEIVFYADEIREQSSRQINLYSQIFQVCYNGDNTFFVDESRGKTYYVPYHIGMRHELSSQSYFISYLPYYKKIEILNLDAPGSDLVLKEHIGIATPVEDEGIIARIEHDFEVLYLVLKEQIDRAKKEQDEKEAQKREKLFATTDVLKRAKILYGLLKIPQNIQDEIYKKITREDEVFNTALLEYDYMAWEEGGWEDKDDLAYVGDIFNKYNLSEEFTLYHEASPEFVDEFAYMAGLGRAILKHNKTLCCLIGSGTHSYVIIDSDKRDALDEEAEGLKKHGEITELLFFDEIGQTYPLPRLDIFEQLDYKLKPRKGRSIEDVCADLIEYNEYLLGDAVPKTIDPAMPIFADIQVECKCRYEPSDINATFTLALPEQGFSFAGLCFALEQEIARIVGFSDDVFSIGSFVLGDDQQKFTLQLFSAKMDILRVTTAFKDLALLCAGEASSLVMGYFQTGRLEEIDSDYDRLHDFISYQHELDCSFIIHLDWKSPIESLDDDLEVIFRNYYPNINVTLPNARDFDEDDGVGSEGVFVQYDQALREAGLQFGFFDVDGDEYLLVVHKICDEEKVKEVFLRIGWDYFNAEDVE